MMNGSDKYGWDWAGMTIMVIAAVVIAGCIIWAVSRRAGNSQVPARSARDLLDARLASGAIDIDEFHKRLDALARSDGGSPYSRD
jgi:uncharacterized membrane protein